MKRVYVLSMMLLFALLGWSQSTSSSQQIDIKFKNGNSVQINANDVDYFEFTESGNDNPQPVPEPVPEPVSPPVPQPGDNDNGKGDMSGKYLTFVALEDVRFKFISNVDNVDGVNRVSYSLDGGSNWVSLPNNTYTPMVQSGQKIMWKGTFRHELFPNDGKPHTFNNRFCCTGSYNVEGNIMSLLYGDDFIGKTSLADTYEVFTSLFNGWFPDSGSLVNAENLILPATILGERCYEGMFLCCASLTTLPSLPAMTLASHCYNTMFDSCSSLTSIPNNYLPATTMAEHCYNGMFAGCTSLTTAPSLPATTLANSCYYQMFNGCTSLTIAPELPATRLVEACYAGMFRDCSSLSHIKCLATNISARFCLSNWVVDVSSSGTFVKASSMNNWSTGVNGIPTNWTVKNE